MNETTTTAEPKQPVYNSNPFSRTFKGLDLLFKYNQSIALVLLIISLVTGLLQFAGNFVPSSGRDDTASLPDIGHLEPANVALLVGGLIILGLISAALVALISTYINGITKYVAWKTSRRETTSFSESFHEVTKRFWTILVVQVVTTLKIIGGFLLFVIPGIRAALRYEMVLFPVFEENLNSKQAMKRIKQLTKGRLIEVFGIQTVATIIPVIGLLLAMGGEAVMYPELKALKASGAKGPKPHWLNYIGLIVLSAFLVIISLFVVLLINWRP